MVNKITKTKNSQKKFFTEIQNIVYYTICYDSNLSIYFASTPTPRPHPPPPLLTHSNENTWIKLYTKNQKLHDCEWCTVQFSQNIRNDTELNMNVTLSLIIHTFVTWTVHYKIKLTANFLA